MDKDNHSLLNEEIARHFMDISQMEIGSDKINAAIGDLERLYKLRIDENQTEWAANDRDSRRAQDEEASKREYELKIKQMDRDYEIKTSQLNEQAEHRTMEQKCQENEQNIKQCQIDNDYMLKSKQLMIDETSKDLERKSLESDDIFKQAQLREQKLDRIVKIALTGTTIAVNIGVLIFVMTYEQSGSFTTQSAKETVKNILKPPKMW